MMTSRKSATSAATRLRPTLVRRHNENNTFLRQLPKAEKVRMVQIESEWDIQRALSVLSRLDERQLTFIETACGIADVPEMLEALGMRRYAQLLAFLGKLDAALVQMEVHPSEVYYTTPALYAAHSVVTSFDLTANFGYEIQQLPSRSKEPGAVLMGVFHRFCDAAGLLKSELLGREFFERVWERIRDDQNLQPLSAIPTESVRDQRAREIASTLAAAFAAEANAPDFAIPEQVTNEFVTTISDEQVFKLLLVRSGQ